MLFAINAPARAQQNESETDRLVREGLVEVLAARLNGARDAESLRQLAEAHGNAAARITDPAARHTEFEAADARYRDWGREMERVAATGDAAARLELAAARTAHAAMILNRWCAVELDEWELTDGRRFDRARTAPLLRRTRDLCTQALAEIDAILRQLQPADDAENDAFLASAEQERATQIARDARFHVAWAGVHLARSEAAGASRDALLKAADHEFSHLLAQDLAPAAAARVRVGRSVALRAMGDGAAASRELAAARTDAEPWLAGQIAYLTARLAADARDWNTARTALEPLLSETPAGGAGPSRFHRSLALLWQANLDLLEAQTLPKHLARAASLRDSGLTRCERLAARGDEWRRTVTDLILERVDATATPNQQTPVELLWAARKLDASGRPREARDRLTAAAGRRGVAPDIAGEILFELGVVELRLERRAEAAGAWLRLGTEQPEHARAAAALWNAQDALFELARTSEQPAREYARAIDALERLIRAAPSEANTGDLRWRLAWALAGVGRQRDAADAFGAVGRDSDRWDEARLRRLTCLRRAIEADERQPAEESRAAAGRLADDFSRLAAELVAVASTDERGEARRAWAAEAALHAAELRAGAAAGDAAAVLNELEGFEARTSDAALRARAAVVRIGALRRAGRLNEATAALDALCVTTPPAQVRPLLESLTRAASEEAQRLADRGELDAARSLAKSAIPLAERLLRETDGGAPGPAAIHGAARIAAQLSLARLLALDERYADALRALEGSLAAAPRDGELLRFRAVLSSAQVRVAAEAERPALRAVAREAWGALLADEGLRDRLPERFWEARLAVLELLLDDGRRDDVRRAIQQERVWDAELGGAATRARLEELERRAAIAP